MSKKLTKRQAAFVENMANPEIKSVRQAALKAGYAESSANTIAYSSLLENTRISEAIQSRINRAVNHHKITPEEVLGSAVFNMRSSMNDLIDEEGYFDLEKARETGAVDLIKEMEIEEKYNLDTKERVVKHKVKFESPAAARKEVANYIGLEKFSTENDLTPRFDRICTRITEEAIVQKCDEKELALLYLSDERAKSLPPELLEMIGDRYLG